MGKILLTIVIVVSSSTIELAKEEAKKACEKGFEIRSRAENLLDGSVSLLVECE